MRILVTNDDGYTAEGLVAVAGALVSAGHDVFVVAPVSERSGSGSSLGSIENGKRIPMVETHLPDDPAVPVYALDCPPALAAIAACAGTFGPPPDLVISGVNPGHNTGRSILFSSTVGALLAARVAGVGGAAVSCGFEPAGRYDTAAEVAVRVADWMIRTGNTRLMLNVNVPDVDFADLRGVAATKLGARSMFSLRTERADGGVLLRRDERSSGFRPCTDSAAVADGYVSVTALQGITGSDDHAALDDSGDSLIRILEREASSAT